MRSGHCSLKRLPGLSEDSLILIQLSMRTSVSTIDQYIAACDRTVQPKLQELREIIRKAAPGTTEEISYGMPAFREGKVLVYFAACKRHIGFYPTGTGVAAFAKELEQFTCTKGSIHLPLDRPLPKKLITQIVKYRSAWERERRALKAVSRK
jgi:uncharacterized protein YdhG (YjbR/CyaY superfamily)